MCDRSHRSRTTRIKSFRRFERLLSELFEEFFEFEAHFAGTGSGCLVTFLYLEAGIFRELSEQFADLFKCFFHYYVFLDDTTLAKIEKFRSCRLILPRISFECNVNTAFSSLLFSRTGSFFIAHRQFSPVRFSMQRYSLRTVAKYRHANGSRMFTSAFRKSQIGF